MLRPSAFCDLASRPRSRSRRPSVGAMVVDIGGVGRRFWARQAEGLGDEGLLGHRRFGQPHLGDRPLDRVAGKRRVVAHPRPAHAGVYPRVASLQAGSSVAVADDCVNDMPDEAV